MIRGLLHTSGPPGGPLVARTFHRALALLYFAAFLSLGSQVHLLFGTHGLQPLADTLAGHRRNLDAGILELPTLFFLRADDLALSLACALGIILSLASLFSFYPRVLAPILATLYLAFASVGQPFLSFQWDNLLVEAGFLAAFLPRDRPSRLAHLMFVALAIKLYFESGIAKVMWGGEQWWSGEAMQLYYETAPLPGPLGLEAHHLPAWWHLVESRGIVVLELGLPWLLLGPRPIRLAAATILAGFQAINVLTANYGFFVWLTLALHLFALDDRDLAFVRARTWDRLRFGAAPEPTPVPRLRRIVALVLTAIYFAYWLLCSVVSGWNRFDTDTLASAQRALAPWHEPFLTANTYHLFGPITKTRDEVEFQIDDGHGFVAAHTEYKPGRLDRRGPWVQPHQPRVDFQLWFLGLTWRRGMPPWIRTLMRSLCEDPTRVQPLFADTLPASPKAVRLVFWRYHYVDADTHARTGAVWTRSKRGESPPVPCRLAAQPQRVVQES